MELKSSSFNSLQHNQTKDLPYKLSKLALLALWVIISNLYMHSFPEKTKKLKKNKQTNKQTGYGSQSMEGQPHNFVTQKWHT